MKRAKACPPSLNARFCRSALLLAGCLLCSGPAGGAVPGVCGPGAAAGKGRLEIRLVPPPGSEKTSTVTVAIAKLNTFPWNAFRLVEVDGTGGNVELSPGYYLVQCGQRNARGDVFLALKTVFIEEGDTVTVELQGGLPPEGGRVVAEGPKVPRMKKLPRTPLRDAGKHSYTLSALLRKGPVLLAFFSVEQEPSRRMIPVLAARAKAFVEAGVRLVGVQVQGGPSGRALQARAEKEEMALPLLLADTRGIWVRAFGIESKMLSKHLPLLVLLDEKRAVRFRQEGYDLNLAPKVDAILQWAKERNRHTGRPGGKR